jgi:hypothetical protein
MDILSFLTNEVSTVDGNDNNNDDLSDSAEIDEK